VTRLVSWFDAVLWWLDERRAIRHYHLAYLTPVLSSGRRRGVWERRRRTSKSEAPASRGTTRRVTGGENSDAHKA
jgi:hypothetical protein